MSTTNLDPDHATGENVSNNSSSPETNTPVLVSSSSTKSEKTVTEETKSSSMSISPLPGTPPGFASNEHSIPDTAVISKPGDDSIQFTELDFDAIAGDAAQTGTYTGALLVMVAEVSVVATLISAIAFVSHWPNGVALLGWLWWFIGTPLLFGTVPTLILWLLLAFFTRRSTAVDRMNISSYGELLSHLSTLDAQLISLAHKSKKEPEGNIGDGKKVQLTRTFFTNVDIREVLEYRDAICKKLTTRSKGWVTAVSYVDVWKEMHNAEAALIDVMPLQAVIAGAVGDEMRIQGSNIQTSVELLRKLRLAVRTLDPAAEAYLQPVSGSPQGEKASSAVAEDKMKELRARAVLREVKQTLNDFRDNRWQAIVSLRNQFASTTVFTGIAMYVLLQFAILAGASQSVIMSATAFYLVGALVGLFSRLLSESQTSQSVDDYQLAMVRLAALPLYCGLAAVGGVLFVQKFTSPVDVFDARNILSSLVIAAGFGLTPNLLVNTLQKQVEQQNNDLKSTGASSTK